MRSAVDLGRWLTPRLGRFTYGKKTRGAARDWSGRVRKISPPPGFDPRTV